MQKCRPHREAGEDVKNLPRRTPRTERKNKGRTWNPAPLGSRSRRNDTKILLRQIKMAKKTVADIEVKGKKVLMRCDFNVPLDDKGNITSDDRIVKAMPTIENILERAER